MPPTAAFIASPASTTVSPRDSVQKISSTEMSNDRLVTAIQTSPALCGIRSSMPAKKFAALRCSTMTPLGVPVEPEV